MRVERRLGTAHTSDLSQGVLRTSPSVKRKSSQGSESESRFSELTFHCKGYSV